MKKMMKPAEMERFVTDGGRVYDEGRLSPEYQIREQDLDHVGFLDKHVILGRIPVVLPDSPILYSYLMYVHTKTSIHASLSRTH